MKLNKLSEKYFEYILSKTKIKTRVMYRSIFDIHIASVFGNKDIKKIRQDEIDSFFKLKCALSISTAKLIVTLFKNIINYATSVLKIKLRLNINHTFKCKKSSVEAMTKQEQKMLERYIIDKKKYYDYGIIIALYTGVRIGELLALTWDDIDFKRKTININKTLATIVQEGKTITYVDSPKTATSNRIIPIPLVIIPILKAMLKFQHGKSEFVISKASGKQVYIRAYQTSFNNLLRKIKIKHYGFHSLRHTFATRAVECGVDVKTLSEMLGHSSVGITLNRYVHSSMEQKSRYINKLGKLICSLE